VVVPNFLYRTQKTKYTYKEKKKHRKLYVVVACESYNYVHMISTSGTAKNIKARKTWMRIRGRV
jgi:hypothetical protein